MYSCSGESFAAEVNSQSSVPSHSDSHGSPTGSPDSFWVSDEVLVDRHVLEQAAERQCGGTDAHGETGRVEVVDLPAKGHAQTIERTHQVLELGAGQRRFPRGVGHTNTVCGYAGSVGAKTSITPLISRTWNFGNGGGATGNWCVTVVPSRENEVEWHGQRSRLSGASSHNLHP